MNKIHTQFYKTPHGELVLGSLNDKLCLCDWRHRKARITLDKKITHALNAVFVEKKSEVTQKTKQQLHEYFFCNRKIFDIPLSMVGTDFQKKVWQALIKIPFGSTSTYSQLAISIGNKNAVRAVANANGANAISIIVPCHRIIGSNGKLTGYAGGLHAKEKLLNLESTSFSL